MTKPRTHFEQVPLQIVKKIVEGEIAPEAVNGREAASSKRTMKKEQRARQKKSKTGSRRSSRRGVTK